MDPRLIRLFEMTGDTRALEMRRAHNMMLTGGMRCRLCDATTGLRNGLCKRHREEARRNRGTCIVCGQECDRKKYIHDGCQLHPGGASSQASSSSAIPSAAAAKETTSAGASGSSSAARSPGPRCGICWGVENLKQYDGNLWYHHACLIQWEADWTRVRGTSLPRRRIPRGYVPLSRLPPNHRLRFARREAFIPMTFDEYKRVHMVRCKQKSKKCTEHHIQSDWTSHNDIYRQKIHGRREDAPNKMHIRGPASHPPFGVQEDVELRVEVMSDGTRYAIYNPHFLLLDGKPLTDNQFDRMVEYIQQRKRPTPPQNPDAHLHMDGHPLMFQHIGGEENVTVDEVIGNPSNILESEIIAYVKRRRQQYKPTSNGSGAGVASKSSSSSSSSSSSGAASAARYACSECARTFTRRDHLLGHIREVHKKEKPFQCTSCGKLFSKKSNLNTHIRTHTGAKPFVCQFCEKSFTQKAHLEYHVKSKHKGQAAPSESSSSFSSSSASAVSKPPSSSAAASSSRKRKEQSLPISPPRIVQRRRVEEFEGDEDDPVIIDDDEGKVTCNQM